MKFLAMMDIHARAEREIDERPIDGMPAPLYDFARLGRRVAEIVKDEGIAAVLILGDLFHHRRVMSLEALILVIRVLRDIGAPVYVLGGNHDLVENMSRLSSLEAVPTITPVLTSWDTILGSGKGAIYTRWVPYDRSEQKMIDDIGAVVGSFGHRIEALTEMPKLLFTHGTFVGVHAGPHDYAGRSIGIPMKTVAGYRFTLTGHWHTHQVLAQPGRPTTVHRLIDAPRFDFIPAPGSVVYGGTPYAHNFHTGAESLHGVWVLDSETLMLSHRPVPGPVFASVSSLAAAEAVLARAEPQDINLRVVDAPESERRDLEEIGAVCRSFAILGRQIEASPLGARHETAAAARDGGDPAMISAWLQSQPDRPDTVEYLTAVAMESLAEG